MPRGGQNKKTIAEKIRNGTHHESNTTEIIPVGQALTSPPPAPDYFDEGTKIYWYNLIQDFCISEVVESVDLNAIEKLVSNTSRYYKIQAWIRDLEDNYSEWDKEEWIKYNDLSRISSRLDADIRKREMDFGMSPAARRNLLSKPKSPGKDPIFDLVMKKNK